MTGKEAKEKWKKQYDYRNQYTKNNYDRISVTVPKGLKDQIKALLEDRQTVNGLINQLLTEWIEEQERQQIRTIDQYDTSTDFPDMPFK